jgi:hypothetical protein
MDSGVPEFLSSEVVCPSLVGAQSATLLSGGTINGAAQAAEVRRLQALTPHDPSHRDVERVLTGMHYPRR